jgi:hypothetical protein
MAKILNNELLKKYNFLVDTLIMAAVDLEAISDEKIAAILAELEGDYYTFLYPSNLEIFEKNKILNNDQIQKIIELRVKIDLISPKLWNVDDFKKNPAWYEVKKLSKKILTSMNITKRKVDDKLINPSM